MESTLAATIQAYFRSRPRVYDAAKRAKRTVLHRRTPAYEALDEFSRELGRQVRFVQIGANDGLRNDPIREFIVRDKWAGVLVEPLPYVVDLLKRNYPARRFPHLQFRNAAATAEIGTSVTLWSFSEQFLSLQSRERRLEYLRKASFNREHVAQFLPPGVTPEEVIVEIEVPGVTVDSLARSAFPDGKFDLLVIDAEGYEPAILRSIDFERTRPRAIFFEAQHLSGEQEALEFMLKDAGYRLTHLAGDSFATLPAIGLRR